MFKRLKAQLMLTMMGAMLLILLGAMVFVYMTVNVGIQQQVSEDLGRILRFDGEKPGDAPVANDAPTMPERRPKEERQIAFTLYFDAKGSLVRGFAFFEPQGGFFEAVNEALKATEPNLAARVAELPSPRALKRPQVKQLSVDYNEWAYMAMQNPAGDGSFKVSFLDITPQKLVLASLLRNFALVSLGMLVAILALSWLLMRRSVAPVEAAYERQRRFVSDASHELKTPLAVMQTNLSALSASEVPEERVKWQGYIGLEIERMTKLTQQLLYLAQNEGQETLQKIDKRPLPLRERLSHQLMQYEVLFYEAGLSLEQALGSAEVVVQANPEQLDQVLAILLDNAAKYTPKGGQVVVSLEQEGHYATIAVANSGPGIDPEDLPYIFDRFYRSSQHRDRTGYGLGLAIAKAIVEHHGGELRCYRAEEKTVFTVRLSLR